MMGYLFLGIATLTSVAVAVVFYLLEHKTAFGKLKYYQKQIIIGLTFGGIAVLSTEFGISMNGAMANCRDGAVITAGLMFGGPAGIIAGLIGGIERWLCVYWGVGAFTRVACTLATIIAGFVAAGLRKILFENKKPAWQLAFVIGIIVEVFHMIMVFVTNISTPVEALHVIQNVSAPMIIANALAPGLSAICITLLSKEKIITHRTKEKVHISQTIQRWLFLYVAIAFVLTSVFTYFLQVNMALNQTSQLLNNVITDIDHEIQELSDQKILNIANRVKDSLGSVSLDTLKKEENVAEINLINSKGIITESTNPDLIGFDMTSGEQSSEFLCLLGDVEFYVQKYGPITYNTSLYRKYAGVKLGDGFLQVGYDSAQFESELNAQIIQSAKNRTVGKNGYIVIVDEQGTVISPENRFDSNAIALDSVQGLDQIQCAKAQIEGTDCYVSMSKIENYYVFSVISAEEAFETCYIVLYVTMYLETLIFAMMFVTIYMLIRRIVVNKMLIINNTLGEITGGNMNATVNVRSNEEFASLSDDINTTVDTLKHYIDLAASRLDQELQMAKEIQSSVLPTNFPDCHEYEIFASMQTAKQVGGDFYDFYSSEEDVMNITIADVSGKGIPAALFMMRAKSELKDLSETGVPINEVFTVANSRLCDGNDADMFVTAWQAQINLETGLVRFANAGHNFPVIRHGDGSFAFLKSKAGFVLAGMDGIHYAQQEAQLEPGDIIYLYTDGITEATNLNNELFGDDRLLDTLNQMQFETMEELCNGVTEAVSEFTGEAPQFDDMTMLAFRYHGKKPVPTIHFDHAKIEDISAVTEFIEGQLETMGCSMKSLMQVNVAVDEVYSNIANYAYDDRTGPATVTVAQDEKTNCAVITFIDEGKPYNPLMKEDPDVTLRAEERKIGGLGIYMVKKMMDEVQYLYIDDRNILKLWKKL